MRTLLSTALSIPLLYSAPCSTEEMIVQLGEIRAQLEQNKESEARGRFKKLAKDAAPCAKDLRVGNIAADLAIRLHQPKDALRFATIVEQSSAENYGPRSIQHAISLETYVQALTMNNREVEAEKYLREAMAIVDEHGGETSLFKIGLWNLLGTLHARLNDPEGAQRQFERAWNLIKDRPDLQLRVIVLHNLAANAQRMGRTAEAQEHMAEVHRNLDRLPPSLQREIQSWSPVKGIRQ